jgi:hypothetical protein
MLFITKSFVDICLEPLFLFNSGKAELKAPKFSREV